MPVGTPPRELRRSVEAERSTGEKREPAASVQIAVAKKKPAKSSAGRKKGQLTDTMSLHSIEIATSTGSCPITCIILAVLSQKN
jgi:hypothetical protein